MAVSLVFRRPFVAPPSRWQYRWRPAGLSVEPHGRVSIPWILGVVFDRILRRIDLGPWRKEVLMRISIKLLALTTLVVVLSGMTAAYCADEGDANKTTELPSDANAKDRQITASFIVEYLSTTPAHTPRQVRADLGPDTLPTLYAMLKEEEYKKPWYQIVKGIADIGGGEESVSTILDYVQRDDDFSPLGQDEFFCYYNKMRSISLLGFFDLPSAEKAFSGCWSTASP